MKITIEDIQKLDRVDIDNMDRETTLQYLNRARNTINRRGRQLVGSGLWSPAVEAMAEGIWLPISYSKKDNLNTLKKTLRKAVRYSNYTTGTVAKAKKWQKRTLKKLNVNPEDFSSTEARTEWLKQYWKLYREWQEDMGGKMTTKYASSDTTKALADVFSINPTRTEKESMKDQVTKAYEQSEERRNSKYERERLDELIWGPTQTD